MLHGGFAGSSCDANSKGRVALAQSSGLIEQQQPAATEHSEIPWGCDSTPLRLAVPARLVLTGRLKATGCAQATSFPCQPFAPIFEPAYGFS